VTLAFWDSSALLKLLVEESGTDVAVALWDRATAVAASRLAVPEMTAALAAAERGGRIDRERRRVAEAELRRYVAALDVVELTPGIGEHAADLAATHPLSGADAVHLATGLALHDRAMVFATWDRRLATAATAEGLGVVPALSDAPAGSAS
jgi:predicted nucleic acid-binding protein